MCGNFEGRQIEDRVGITAENNSSNLSGINVASNLRMICAKQNTMVHGN